mgnify:CR=1 FL=1
MANYPEWVLKYKTKGYYVNKYKDHYRLYKGHCERINGKNVRIVDFYCGTITEKDGFIPSSGLIKGNIIVLDYGFYYFMSLLSNNIYNGQLKLHKKYADTIMVFAIGKAFNISEYKLKYSALNRIYTKFDEKYKDNEIVLSEINRVSLMILDVYNKNCSSINDLKDILSTLTLVQVNKRYYLSKCDDKVYEIFNNFGFEVNING